MKPKFSILDFGFSIEKSTRKRILCFAFFGLLFAFCATAEAQQAKRVPRIGYLSLRSGLGVYDEAFRQGLRELGYTEGQNILIEWRFVKGKSEQYHEIAGELVRLKVDAIVTASGDEPIIAAMNATKTIPVIFLTGSDPVALRFVSSLAHPGGNATGLAYMLHDLNAKRLQLLKEVVPKLFRVAVLGDRDHQNHNSQLTEVEVAAKALGLKVQPVQLRVPDDLENAFSSIARDRADAIFVLSNPAIGFFLGKVVEFSTKTDCQASMPPQTGRMQAA